MLETAAIPYHFFTNLLIINAEIAHKARYYRLYFGV